MISKIIVCSNIAGAGKDTFADYLVKKHGFTKLFFAEGIYDIARKYFGMTEKDRALLQTIGEKMREIYPNIWIDYTLRQANELIAMGKPVIISDLRRENEFNASVAQGFYPIRIVANRDLAIERLIKRDGKCDTSLLDNQSETGTRHITMEEITNNELITDFYKKIDLRFNL